MTRLLQQPQAYFRHLVVLSSIDYFLEMMFDILFSFLFSLIDSQTTLQSHVPGEAL